MKPAHTMAPVAVVLVGIVSLGTSQAQPARSGGTQAEVTAPGETTVLIPPGGGTADIPVHFTDNVMLTFPSPAAPRALQSGPDWDITDFANGAMVRATKITAPPITLALRTQDGAVTVNVSLRVVPASDPGLKVVRFQASTAEEAFKAAVEAEAERRTAPLRAELTAAKKQLDAKIRDRATAMVGRGILARLEQVKVVSHARNDDNVIVHVERAVFLGDDAYLVFDIQNRSGSAYRLARVSVQGSRGTQHAGTASLATSTVDAVDAGLIGVVPAGTTGHAVVLLRQVDALLGAPLTLTIEQPEGRGRVVVDRGIVLR